MKMLDTLLFGNPGGPRGLVSGGKQTFTESVRS